MIDNTECWSAGELSTLWGYQQWRDFSNVIDKAKEACNNAGQSVWHLVFSLALIVAYDGLMTNFTRFRIFKLLAQRLYSIPQSDTLLFHQQS